MHDSARPTEMRDQLVEQWSARIARSSGTTVEGILMQGENVLNALRDLRPYGPQARRMLELRARLSRPTMSKLEAIGRHAGLLRLRANRLPASMSSLYVLTQRPWRHFLKAIETDLRGMSRAEISCLFTAGPPKAAMCPLMTIVIPRTAGKAARPALIADINAALMQIGERHAIDLQGRAARVSSLP
ncbi:hypothetical protein [Taklimakanibacter lacteus]|uniref:hypothetical protein n=1 Tax=Taklimakanibacter lacteus TaxID=2268456 RepID=UPI0013C4003E